MLLLPFLMTLGCQTQVTQTDYVLPSIYISDLDVDFGAVDWESTEFKTLYIENQGELPMGIHPIVIAEEGFESNFTLTYYPEAMTCEDPSVRDVTDSEDWDPNLQAGDFILFGGCKISLEVRYHPYTVGDSYASFHVYSFIEEAPTEDADGNTISTAGFKPSFYRDPAQFDKTVMLHGSTALGNGNITVNPRTLDFGHSWTGQAVTKQVMINNVGDGNLLLGRPYLGSDCDPAEFSLDLAALDSDYVVPAGHGTIFEVTFTPSDIDDRACHLIVPSDDVDSPEIAVRLKGNIGTDPNNQAPTVQLISPQPGYMHNTSQPLHIELSMFDVNQPANTLFCKVKSQILNMGSFNCSAEGENGYVSVEIPAENLGLGVDTWLITVTDQAELQAFASTTVIFGDNYPESDDDGDGYGTVGDFIDCDDNNINVYPSAAELVDGLDNDCDLQVDERTIAGDDDGDSVSELEGDCDDNDPESYPGAPEQPDLKDNDCDGIVDEKTSLSDDDGDGFAEVDNDCNDRNPDINPAAVELCDGIDNNCNNLRDAQEGCVSIDSDPVIIGGVQMGARAISVGESTTMTIFVHEEDGQDVTYYWQNDAVLSNLGHNAVSDSTAQTITWTAPDDVDGDGEIFNIYVLVTDEDGNQDWVFDEISVYNNPVTPILTETTTAPGKGCSSSSALFLPLLPLIGWGMWRRRRE